MGCGFLAVAQARVVTAGMAHRMPSFQGGGMEPEGD
jgi:hypothetical protein